MKKQNSHMEVILSELASIQRRCMRAASRMREEPLRGMLNALSEASNEIARAWSGSWAGYHSNVYYGDFEPPPPGTVFSQTWGFSDAFSNPTSGDWREWSGEDVVTEILRRAGNPDESVINSAAEKVTAVFTECRDEFIATLDALLADAADKRLQESRDKITKIEPVLSAKEIVKHLAPRRIETKDPAVELTRIETPAHISVQSRVLSIGSRMKAAQGLAEEALSVKRYLEQRLKLKGVSVARTSGTIFIGHGRSPAWLELKTSCRIDSDFSLMSSTWQAQPG